MAKLLVGTPIRKPRHIRDMEENPQSIDYQPNEMIETGEGGLDLTAAETAQYIREGVLVEPVKVKPPAKTKEPTKEPAASTKGK